MSFMDAIRYVLASLMFSVLHVGVLLADSFTQDLEYLASQSETIVGRDAKVEAYTQLLEDYPDHPERARAMLEIASLWQTSNPDLKVSPDPKMEIEWLRRASLSATSGSELWIECRFRLANRICFDNPDESKRMFSEILTEALKPIDELRANHGLQLVARLKGEFDEAERLCIVIQEWRSVNESRMPPDALSQGNIFEVMEQSALDMMMTWAEMSNLGKADRIQRIDSFASKYEGRRDIVASRERALSFLKSLEEKLGKPVEAAQSDETAVRGSKTRSWFVTFNVLVIAAIAAIFVVRKRRIGRNAP